MCELIDFLVAFVLEKLRYTKLRNPSSDEQNR